MCHICARYKNEDDTWMEGHEVRGTRSNAYDLCPICRIPTHKVALAGVGCAAYIGADSGGGSAWRCLSCYDIERQVGMFEDPPWPLPSFGPCHECNKEAYSICLTCQQPTCRTESCAANHTSLKWSCNSCSQNSEAVSRK